MALWKNTILYAIGYKSTIYAGAYSPFKASLTLAFGCLSDEPASPNALPELAAAPGHVHGIRDDVAIHLATFGTTWIVPTARLAIPPEKASPPLPKRPLGVQASERTPPPQKRPSWTTSELIGSRNRQIMSRLGSLIGSWKL